MDNKLRDAARIFRSQRDLQAGHQLITAASRAGFLPEQHQILLSLFGDPQIKAHVGSATPIQNFFYFVCGSNDASDTLEADRITWLRTNVRDKFVLFRMIRIGLRALYWELFSDKNREEILPLFGYTRPGAKTVNNESEYARLKKGIDTTLSVLEQIEPGVIPPVAHIEMGLSAWAAITAEEGRLTLPEETRTKSSRSARDAFQKKWHRALLWQHAIDNLINMLLHLVMALQGKVGEPYELEGGRDNRRYTGSPFLWHWSREHGSLNPGHHLNFGQTTRLNLLTYGINSVNTGIDWYVVYSNCLAGLFLTSTILLKLDGIVPPPVDSSAVEDGLEQLNRQLDRLERQHLSPIPQRRRLVKQLEELQNDQFMAVADGDEEAEIEINQRIQVINQQILAIDSGFPQIIALRGQVDTLYAEGKTISQIREKLDIGSLQNQLEQQADVEELREEAYWESLFWAHFAPTICLGVVEDLSILVS